MTVIQAAVGAPHLTYQVTWEKLPDDYVLPDDPVDNTSQPLLSAALRESLELVGWLTIDQSGSAASLQRLIASNLGICVTVNGKTIVKAPDWFYAAQVRPLEASQTRRSYTPRLEGAIPAIVMEFLSDIDGGEYSVRPFAPYGKYWFYERILRVPIYVIFEPESGTLEVRQLVEETYQIQTADPQGHYWIEAMQLSRGVWQGTKADRTGYWLRWWDQENNVLLWGAERLEQERQRAEQERQRAEQERQRAEQERQRAGQERQRADRLAELLRAQGIDLDADDE